MSRVKLQVEQKKKQANSFLCGRFVTSCEKNKQKPSLPTMTDINSHPVTYPASDDHGAPPVDAPIPSAQSAAMARAETSKCKSYGVLFIGWRGDGVLPCLLLF